MCTNELCDGAVVYIYCGCLMCIFNGFGKTVMAMLVPSALNAVACWDNYLHARGVLLPRKIAK